MHLDNFLDGIGEISAYQSCRESICLHLCFFNEQETPFERPLKSGHKVVAGHFLPKKVCRNDFIPYCGLNNSESIRNLDML